MHSPRSSPASPSGLARTLGSGNPMQAPKFHSGEIDIWDHAVQLPTWDGPDTWIHADLMPGNILTTNGRLSAVIDFGAAGLGDPGHGRQRALHHPRGPCRLPRDHC